MKIEIYFFIYNIETMYISLKYKIITLKSENTIYICVDDHRCGLKDCKINLDNAEKVTIPFDLSKKFRITGGGSSNGVKYWIGYNLHTKEFKQFLNKEEIENRLLGIHLCGTNLDKQFNMFYWTP